MFYEQTTNGVTVLKSDIIPVTHGFTTRVGGVSSGAYAALNLRRDCGDDYENVKQNYQILAGACGFDLSSIAQTRQIHLDTVLRADAPRPLYDDTRPECDALISNTPGLTLLCYAADCVLILLYDAAHRAVAAVHAGWRSTALCIVEKALEAMRHEFGTRPDDVTAAIGPGICTDCFEVDRDVADALTHTNATSWNGEPLIKRKGEKFHPDLKRINALALINSGVPRTSIDICDLCSRCRPDLFWSHRRDGKERGVMAGFVEV